MRRSLTCCLWMLALAGLPPMGVVGDDRLLEDGTLIDSTVVTLKPETLEAVAAKWPEGRSALSEVEIKAITYASDGLKVKGYLVTPKSVDNKKLPCVIFCRGGNRDLAALDEERVASLLGRIASWGYVVVASQYRGNAGGEGKEEFGGKDLNDVLNLIPLLESMPEADASRIGMYGWSRGGMMTYQALATTDRIAAAIVGGGIADQFKSLDQRPEMERVLSALIPHYDESKDEALAARSVIRWPEALHKGTPILILHGSADWRVDPAQSIQLVQKLHELRHPVRFVLFEGGDHGLTEYRAEVNRIAKEWLDYYVRDQKPWPSLDPHGK